MNSAFLRRLSQSSFRRAKSFLISITLVLLAACQTTQQSRIALPDPQTLAGLYDQDGLTYNVRLELKPNGAYTAQWMGCVGNAGSASGNWSLDGQTKRLVFTPTEETGMMHGQLKTMELIKSKRDGQWIFLPDNWRDFYKKYGPEFSCYQRVKASNGAPLNASVAQQDLQKPIWPWVQTLNPKDKVP